MSEIIVCTIEGLTFSFRKPRFENYQATHVIPPKSVIVGMIVNALNRGESVYYPLLKEIKYSPILLDVESRFIDLWTAIQGKKGDKRGKRGIFYREHLFRAKYRVYLYSEKYLDDIWEALSQPQNIVYLGKSEDLVKIHSLEKQPLKRVKTNKIRDIIPIEWMSLITSVDWKLSHLRILFPPSEESLIDSYIPPAYDESLREQRSVERTQEVYVALGGEFLLKELIEAISVDEGNIYFI